MVEPRCRSRLPPQLTRLAISAIVVAIQMLQTHCEKAKFRKGKDVQRITLTTSCDGSVDADQLEAIARKLKEESIELTIL